MIKDEKIRLANIILNQESSTFFEVLYALEYIDHNDICFKKHKGQLKYWKDHIYLKKPIVEYYDDVGMEMYIDPTTEIDIQKEFDFIEHCYLMPNKMSDRIERINEALIKNGHKPISYIPFDYQ